MKSNVKDVAVRLVAVAVILAVAVVVSFAVAGCGGGSQGDDGFQDPPSLNAFKKFKDKGEFGQYLEWVKTAKEEQSENTGGSNSSPAQPATQDQTGGNDSSPAQPTTQNQTDGDKVETNNQSEGVDEGDIIKFAGDRLVILRDQHLMVLDVSGERAQKPVILSDRELDADFGQGSWGKGAWYDEMLVFGSRIVLIAYRFHVQLVSENDTNKNTYTGAIELLKFDIADDGTLKGDERVFIESSDYYSGATNYATRKIGDRLIVFSPFYVMNYYYTDNKLRMEEKLPSLLELVDAPNKLFKRSRPSIDYTDIYKGTVASSGYVLHSIYSFNVNDGLDKFDVSGVVGGYGIYYVTNEHFYVDIARWWWTTKEDRKKNRSVVHQFDISEGVALANMAEVEGSVPERFAMSEKDGVFCMITQDYSWEGRTVKINASKFDAGSFENIGQDAMQMSGYGLSAVRFNGDFAILSGDKIYLADFTKDAPRIAATEIAKTDIELMQPFGENRWVAFGSYVNSSTDRYESGLDLGLLELGDAGSLSLVASAQVEGGSWSEAFWNDHAFFMDEGRELIGFPYSSWGAGNALRWENGVKFFSAAGNKFTALGAGIVQTGDFCEECWYGNSRVVRSADYYYNLLGRQLKVSVYDAAAPAMKEVYSMELFAVPVE